MLYLNYPELLCKKSIDNFIRKGDLCAYACAGTYVFAFHYLLILEEQEIDWDEKQ